MWLCLQQVRVTLQFGYSCVAIGAPLDIMDRGILVASSMELAQAMLPHISHITKYERD